MVEGIVYALVAHGTILLAEYSNSSGNFTQVAHELLEKIGLEKDSRMTYTADRHTFNYIVKNKIIYMCLAHESFGTTIPFAFLEKIAKLFEGRFGKRARDSVVPYSLNADFAPVLVTQMNSFTSGNENKKLHAVKHELDQVKGVMQENINMVLERGEKLEHLVVQSESLMDSSQNFRSGASRLKDQMWWNNQQIRMMILAGGTLLILILVATACGGATFPKCF